MVGNLDVSKYKLIAGNPSVDFVNTVSGSLDHPDQDLRDKLKSYADVVAWSWLAKLLTDKEARRLLQLAEKEPRTAETVFQRALTLREALYRLFKAVIEGKRPESKYLDRLNQELAIAYRHESLGYDRRGFGWQWSDREYAFDAMLWQLSQVGAELLASGELPQLRQCGGEQCGWMFLDTSRNHSRLWCDMKDCGNLAKVRRFRQKRSA
jgi:predicted RNA-binding Zn ribbon-like protein